MHKEGLLCQNVTAEGIRDYDTVCMKNKMGRIGMKYIRLLIIFSNKKSSLLSYQLISSCTLGRIISVLQLGKYTVGDCSSRLEHKMPRQRHEPTN